MTEEITCLPKTVQDSDWFVRSEMSLCETNQGKLEELKSHRVQVVIRGSRFESTLPVWTTYSAAIYLFFALPLNIDKLLPKKQTHETNDSSSDDHVNKQEYYQLEEFIASMVKYNQEHSNNKVYVSDIIELLDVKTHEALTTQLFTLHYTQSVYPVIVQGVMSDKAPQTVSECDKEHKAYDELGLLNPSPFCIETINFDANRQLWQFHFTRRLTDDVIEHYNNLQTKGRAENNNVNQQVERELNSEANNAHTNNKWMASNKSNETVDMLLDPNASPFLLLQPEYMGVVLVYLRRCYQAYTTNTNTHNEKKQSTNGNNASPPVLPLRWTEMDFDAQLSLCQLTRSLGLVPLMQSPYKYDFLTASLSSSLFIKLQKWHITSKSECLNEYGVDVTAVKSNDIDDNDDENDYDDNDTKLLLPPTGCVCCGRSGHNADTCPFMGK